MSTICEFCASTKLKESYRGQFHKVDQTFGPFNLYTCEDCGSLGTSNKPSLSRLADFYQNYNEHRPAWYNAAAANAALSPQYQYYAKFLLSFMPTYYKSWVDVGAGHGEVATLISGLRPECLGVAVDIGNRPLSLPKRVDYLSVDLNASNWLSKVERQFDLVFSVAVWEHVVSPAQFAQESLSLVAPGGTLVMVTPDYGSLASRLLRQNWPYFEPGEHLSIPTRKGANACIRRAANNLRMATDSYSVKSSMLMVGYSLSYLFSVLRLTKLASFVPPRISAPLPTGVLATIVRRY